MHAGLRRGNTQRLQRLFARGAIRSVCVEICSYQGREKNLFAREALNPEIHQIEKLRFLSISRCTFKLRFQFTLKWYRGI